MSRRTEAIARKDLQKGRDKRRTCMVYVALLLRFRPWRAYGLGGDEPLVLLTFRNVSALTGLVGGA